jgi:hypothetical protein
MLYILVVNQFDQNMMRLIITHYDDHYLILIAELSNDRLAKANNLWAKDMELL